MTAEEDADSRCVYLVRCDWIPQGRMERLHADSDDIRPRTMDRDQRLHFALLPECSALFLLPLSTELFIFVGYFRQGANR
jgi:hypothetical protein